MATPAGPGSSRGGAGQVRAESSQALAPLPVVETAGSSAPSSLAKRDEVRVAPTQTGQPWENNPLYARTIWDIGRSCQKDQPLQAGDDRWEDFSQARGDRATRKLLGMFLGKPQDQFLQVLFASHRGAGKTTELFRMQDALKTRYRCLYLEANVQMDANQIEVEDLFVVLVQGIERFLREAGTPLPKDRLERVLKFFEQVTSTTLKGTDVSVEVETTAKAEAGLLWFAKFLGRVTGLFKAESKHRDEIKTTLKKFPGTLLDSVNLLLDGAAQILAEDGVELLIVIDNLDRYAPEVIDGLLVRNGDRIRQLHCNLLLTPPIGLLYRPHTQQIDTHFPCEVMNTVRLRDPRQPYESFEGPGRNALLAALAKRMDLDRLLPDKRARDRLVAVSGGAIRDLLDLVVNAALVADGQALSLADVEYAVQEKKQRLRDLCNANGFWDTLAAFAKEKQIPPGDAKSLDVLYHRLVLKYNGQGWYDVVPMVAELPEFQRAQQKHSEPS